MTTTSKKRKPERKRNAVRAGTASRHRARDGEPKRRIAKRGTTTRKQAALPVAQTKKAAINALLKQPEGGTLSELMQATGWLEHSVRAALSGLRKQGCEVARSKDAGGSTRYHLTGEPGHA